MAASINDQLTQATVNSRPTPTTVSSTRSAAAGTLACLALTGWPTGTACHFITYKINTSGAKIAGSQCDWKGIVSGTNLTGLVLKAGTDVGNAVGDVVELAPTAAWANDVVAWGTGQHNQDGTHGAVTATSVTVATGKITTTTASKLEDAAIPLSTYRTETMFDHVASGGVWTGDSYGGSLNASMTALVCYINGRRIAIGAVTARAFTLNVDTYIDVLDNADGTGTLVYTTAATNAASPALAANSLRIGIIQVAATITAATKINQGQEDRVFPIASSIAYSVTDSLGNLICPRDPSRKILGYKQIISNFSSGTTVDTLITGLNIPVIVPTGRKIRVTFFATNVTTGGTAVLKVYEGVGSTQIQQANQVSSNSYVTATAYRTPAAGAQTYTFYIGSTVGNPVVGGAASAPAYGLVEMV